MNKHYLRAGRKMIGVAACMALLAGCAGSGGANSSSVASSAASSAAGSSSSAAVSSSSAAGSTSAGSSAAQSGLPAYKYSLGDPKEAALVDYFLAQDIYNKPEGSVMIPAFVIIRTDETGNGRAMVYGNFWCFVYSKKGKTLFCESGGEQPGIAYLVKEGDKYKVEKFDGAGSGADYGKDIVKLSGGDKALENRFFESADTSKEPAKNARMRYIYQYVKDNNLDIDSFQDYGWDPVKITDPASSGPSAGMANPWEETTKDGIMQALGLELNEPVGARNIKYYMNKSIKMEEMRFTLDGQEYVARVQDTGATSIVDNSGREYQWTNKESDKVGNLKAQVMMAKDGDKQVEVILWNDAVPGLSYSLSTEGSDLNGLDIAVIAGQVYKQMQGDS